MIYLKIQELLDERKLSKYWLWKRVDTISYQNLCRIINNETSSIKFDNLEKIVTALNCSFDDIFEIKD